MKHSTKSAPKPKAKIRLEFEAIGTQWVIDLEADTADAQQISKVIADRVSDFDRAYSRFRPDSWVTKIRKPGSYQVPKDFEPLFGFYKQMNQLTSGAVTPLIGDAMERAGYDANYSLVPGALQPIPKFDETLSLQNNTLHVKYPCVLDFGAAGKGYLVDLVCELLEKQGITRYLVDAGGDMRHSPAPGISASVGLEMPENPERTLGTVVLGRSSICGSAGNRRKWANFHHIIDPHTLKSAQEIRATWVVAERCMVADGLATCLFFVEPERLAKHFTFEYLRVKADNTISMSAKFPGTIS